MKIQLISALLFLSAADAQTIPVPSAGSVTLPIDEYNRLTDLATHPLKKPVNSPFPHVLKSSHLNLTVSGESILGSVSLVGEVLAKGNRKVPLVSGMIVLEANQQGNDLPLERENNIHTAILTGPSEFSIDLKTALPLTIEPGRASFSLPVPAAGAVRLTLTIPGEQTQALLFPGIITSRTSQNGQTVIEATLVPGVTASFWWASRLNQAVTPAVPREVRFLSDVKTLISSTEAELAIAALTKVTVVQGEPSEFRLTAPEGYELTGASGSTLLMSDMQGSTILLRIADPASRSHEFLVTLVKSNANVTKSTVPLITFVGTQRETGEVLVESDGAMELNASELGGLRRMDLKELSTSLRSLSRGTLQAAFRYQKRPSEVPGLALDWVRFSDSRVLSAVAQQAEVTTLVTTEGRSLTEIKLTVRNQSQPFLKVELPAGATILSAEVAGEKVKPVQGTDGSRVPLLRAGFRPAGAYQVSFVILNSESPLAKSGDAALTLPKMDLAIGQVKWEVFLPEQLKVSNFAGNIKLEQLFPAGIGDDEVTSLGTGGFAMGVATNQGRFSRSDGAGVSGVLGGIVLDQAGAAVARAVVSVIAGGRSYAAISGPDGHWSIPNVPSGDVSIRVNAPGFKSHILTNIPYDSSRGTVLNHVLEVGSLSESVNVSNSSLQMSAHRVGPIRPPSPAQDQSASTNVGELQRKVVGVLPIAINIPRTGNSYRFLRPLVVDEETRLTFRYRRR